ncbi:hypothetical protein GTA08_BOTSDO05955 [Botryosphaeria dothidea]|uniref:Heterokaryon incompatibility domain-containing protein n=1 Tax=Botryosphaeria dothidea TaxID=55169 RepID=A0A8H4ISA3_9PEZI|nr:hypothetical protein GTA08_BOTSDO05955 [Botryosphaeria dothidea]
MSAENEFRQIRLCARLNFRDVALGNSKAPCLSRDDGFMDFADCVPHHDGLEEVIECARPRPMGFHWPDDDDDGWYIDAKALVDREPRLRRCVLLMAPRYQYPFYETTNSAGVALWLIEEDRDLQMDMPLGFAKFSFRRGMFTPGLAAPGGIQYLWVGALCIIQDSVDDWTHEAGSMNDVYSNAAVALFAKTAASAAERFLGERIIKPTQYLMPPSTKKTTCGFSSH